jgi:hypothetical protein
MDIVTLVPAYKPQYLPDLLSSLRLQTRPSQHIVFSDDSKQGEYRTVLFSEGLAPLRQGLSIECVEGPRRGGYPNIVRLVELWAGRSALVHVMLDDDLLYPSFYERHLVAHASARFSCSISRRWTASETGQPISGQPVPSAVEQTAHRLVSLDSDVVFMTTASECRNWFGEFSNAVFRAETVPILLKPAFEGVSYAGLWDLGAFMAASLQAPIGYIQDHLGSFRTGGQGNSGQLYGPYMKAAHLGYAALGLGGRRLGRYSDTQAQRCFSTIANALQVRYAAQDDMHPFIPLLTAMAQGADRATAAAAEARFLLLWQAYLRQHDF